MSPEQTFLPFTPETLLPQVRALRDEGWRLVQIGAATLGDLVELNYSFDRAGELRNLRLTLPAGAARVPSITPVYWCAFAYENELHDLFRVHVDGIAVDYQGKFYKTTVPFPFGARGPVAAAPAAPAPAVAAPPVATPSAAPQSPAPSA